MIFANLLVLAFLIGCVTGLRSMMGPPPLAFLNSTFSLGRGALLVTRSAMAYGYKIFTRLDDCVG